MLPLQGIVPAAVYSIPTPQDAAKLVAASYSSHQLLTLWSSGSMDCFDINASGNSLKLRTSRKLPAFASSSKAVIPEAQAKPSRARKRRQPEEDTANVPATAQTSSPAIFPLGNHTVAAVRQLTDLPTNGHTASAVEVIVTDSSYGCIQSVTSVKLPKAKADAKLQLQPGSIFQQRTGAGDMVLLFGGAVWLFSIPVSAQHGRLVHTWYHGGSSKWPLPAAEMLAGLDMTSIASISAFATHSCKHTKPEVLGLQGKRKRQSAYQHRLPIHCACCQPGHACWQHWLCCMIPHMHCQWVKRMLASACHHTLLHATLQVKEASLAAAIGALNFRAPANPAALAAAAAVGEEQCESSCRPPQIEHARPAWSQSLAESGEASTSGQPAQFSIALPALFTYASLLVNAMVDAAL